MLNEYFVWILPAVTAGVQRGLLLIYVFEKDSLVVTAL